MRRTRHAVAALGLLFVSPLALTAGTLGLVAARPGAAECGSTGLLPDAGALDTWMARRVPGAPLIGLGAVFIAEASRVGLDLRLLVAIAAHESALGTLGSGADRHNPFGLGPGMRFRTWPDSIRFAADTLRSGYLNDGRITLASIATKWAPVGANNDPTGLNNHWVAGVGDAYAELGGDPAGPVTESASCRGSVVLPGGSVPLPMAGAPQVIGTPNAPGSTHDPHAWPDNWQSDNATDLAMPVGTPVSAVCAGALGPQFGMLDASSASRFGGMRLTVQCDVGVSWYYAHLASLAPNLGPGVRVALGQRLGTSGTANGVPHLHLAASAGNPMVLLGLQRVAP